MAGATTAGAGAPVGATAVGAALARQAFISALGAVAAGPITERRSSCARAGTIPALLVIADVKCAGARRGLRSTIAAQPAARAWLWRGRAAPLFGCADLPPWRPRLPARPP